MAKPTLRIGSRGSALARWQAEHVKSFLAQKFPKLNFEIVLIKTEGDKIQDKSFAQMSGKGFFVKELETALLKNKVDLVVHSLKDLPTELPAGLAIAAVPEREEEGDVFVSRGVQYRALKKGATVGTASPRRQVQLRLINPKPTFIQIRGNVDTRLKKLERGECDGLVLAKAGLKRLGFSSHITEEFSFDEMVPAVGQGALAIEIRAKDRFTASVVSVLNHPPTRRAVTVERDFLAGMGGGCQSPIAAHCTMEAGKVRLSVFFSDGGGQLHIRKTFLSTLAHSKNLGKKAALDVFSNARKVLPLLGKKIVVTQAAGQNGRQLELIRGLGGDGVAAPSIQIKPLLTPEAFEREARGFKKIDYIVFTSVNGVGIFADLMDQSKILSGRLKNAKIAAVGETTAAALVERGFRVSIVPKNFLQEGLLAVLPKGLVGKKILLPQAKRTREALYKELTRRGASVKVLPLYETQPAAGAAPGLEGAHFISFTSPSCVEYFLKKAVIPKGAKTVCIGPVTAKALQSRGIRCDVVSGVSTVEAMVRSIYGGKDVSKH